MFRQDDLLRDFSLGLCLSADCEILGPIYSPHGGTADPTNPRGIRDVRTEFESGLSLKGNE